MMGRHALPLAALAFLLVGPRPLASQETQGSATAEADAAPRREVFVYPTAGRRDPFAPLTAGQTLGPRFDDLELTGVIYSPTAGSVAILRDRATLKRYRAREGDRLGDAELLSIREAEADFLVSGYGVSRRETLRVKKQEQEAG